MVSYEKNPILRTLSTHLDIPKLPAQGHFYLSLTQLKERALGFNLPVSGADVQEREKYFSNCRAFKEGKTSSAAERS